VTEQQHLDRRARRRNETIDEILEISVEVMTEFGVNGLTFAEVARRLRVQTPSLYKYFPSVGAVFDALFKRGMEEHLEVQRAAMAEGRPGLDALTRGLEASGRWALENQALAQLLFWRPVPSFEPSTEAMAPSEEMVGLQKQAIADAVDVGELGPDALIDGAEVASILIKGVLTQALNNEPGVAWGQGRFTPTFPRLMKLLPAAYPPATKRSTARRNRSRATR
jgi:AcrR family transcriptional regulator